MNKIFLMGRLGSEPETREAGSTTITSFSLATTEKYKDKETTQWHQVQFWGKLGETIAKYVDKGHRLLVEGRVEYQEYEKDGVKRYSTKITGESFKFVDSKNSGSGGVSKSSDNMPSIESQPGASTVDVDDLPF